MSEHIAFPSINQYRNAIKLVRERAEHDGLPLPTLTFAGSVKLHGTNAGVQWDEDGAMHIQSRSNLIFNEPKKDNYGFAAFVEANSETFVKIAKPGRVVFGEWCGGSIQGGVAISKLPKMFVVFAIQDAGRWLTPMEIDEAVWFPIRSIYSFVSWFREIDFTRPEEFQNMLADMTAEVERECPVARELGSIGIGEGIVWWPMPNATFNVSDLAFKVKGEKHSETHVKVLAQLDTEVIANIRSLVDTIITENRLQGRLAALTAAGKELDIKLTGDFLKAVAQDVLKEESDTIEASGLPLTQVMQRVSQTSKNWFMQRLS